MARVVKEEEYNTKRNEILDVALRLIYSKGYEQMSIQDILGALQISRGAFYHYFDSKAALLEAMIERMGKEAEAALFPAVHDPGLTAIQKFRRYFESGARWKNMQKTLIVSLMRVWYTDDNAITRQKLFSLSLQHTPRLLEPIIRQGIEEGVFTTPYPEQAAVIVTGIALNLSDTIIGMLLSPEPRPDDRQKLTIMLDAYVDSVERILGAPSGSLRVLEPDTFETWFDAVQPEPASDSVNVMQ